MSGAKAKPKRLSAVTLAMLAPQLSAFRDRFRELVRDYGAEGYELEEQQPEAAKLY